MNDKIYVENKIKKINKKERKLTVIVARGHWYFARPCASITCDRGHIYITIAYHVTVFARHDVSNARAPARSILSFLIVYTYQYMYMYILFLPSTSSLSYIVSLPRLIVYISLFNVSHVHDRVKEKK